MLQGTIAFHDDDVNMPGKVETHVHPSVAAVPAVNASVNMAG